MANNLEVRVTLKDLTASGLAQINQRVSQISKSISASAASVVRWTAAFTGLSTVISVGGIAKFASEIEDLEGRLSGVFEGDLEAAATQLERIRALAADPIVGTNELVDTFIRGATAIRGFSEETLDVLSNVSVTFRRDVGSVFTAWSSGSEKALRQLGIVLDRNGKEWSVNGERIERSLDAVRAKVIEVWQQKFPDAVAVASTRFSGAMKLFQDAVEDVAIEIGDRILPRITVKLNELTRWVEENEGPIVEFAEDAADAVGEFADGVIALGKAIADHEAEWRAFAVLGSLVAIGFGGAKGKIAGTLVLLNQYLALMGKLPVQGQWPAAPPKPGEWFPPMLLPDAEAPFGTGNLGIGLPPKFTPAPAAPTAESGREKFTGILLKDFDDLEIRLDEFVERARAAREKWLAADVTNFGESMSRAFENARMNIKLTNQDLHDFANDTVADIKTAFTDDFAQGLADMMNGVRSFEDSWKGAVTSVLEGLQQIILKMLLMAAYQRFIAPLLGGLFGVPAVGNTPAISTGALTAPASLRTGAQTIVIQPQVNFNAGFVDPTGASEFFARNRETLSEIATGAVVKAIDRVPSFRTRVRG